ncbi:hypothetical protein LINGRAHAP2_LOCUS29193 [Linum grandiflorum]
MFFSSRGCTGTSVRSISGTRMASATPGISTVSQMYVGNGRLSDACEMSKVCGRKLRKNWERWWLATSRTYFNHREATQRRALWRCNLASPKSTTPCSPPRSRKRNFERCSLTWNQTKLQVRMAFTRDFTKRCGPILGVM